MSDWTLRQARYFLAVVDHGSVSAAAREEHLSQGALSMAVAQLESALGVQLLVRGRARPATPTAAGLRFADRLRPILDLADEAGGAARGPDGDPTADLTGELDVGASMTLSPRVFPPLLEALRDRHPRLRTRIAELTPGELEDRVLTGEVDVGFCYHRQLTRDLAVHRIGEVSLHAVLPADHPLAGRRGVTVTELAGLPVILPALSPTTRLLTTLLEQHGPAPDVRWTSVNQETVRAMVGRGLGFTLVSTVPGTAETFDGRRVAYVPLVGAEHRNALVAVTDPRRRPTRAVTETVAVMRGLPSSP
ncbi:LysR family transcriptional regulator [Corynebacterium bovis]|uniref:LysR family transcriptional regulator n=1 Tax=Corynebacterium bovis TaxID=36808 RepID=UPI00313904E9